MYGTQNAVPNGLLNGLSNGGGLCQYNGSPVNGLDHGVVTNPSCLANGLVKVTVINITAREPNDQSCDRPTSKPWSSNKNSQNGGIWKSLSVTIRTDETVSALKSLIVSQTHCGSWPGQCVLYFQGRHLCNDKTLSDYGITNGEATLLMVTRLGNIVQKCSSSENHVLIELANKTTFKIDVDWSSDLVEDVKNKVATVLRTSVNGFHLKHQDTFMKNGERISGYLSPGSLPTVRMITDDDIREAETGNLKILVEIESRGDLIPIESIHDTIAGLKHQIEIRTKIPKEYQCLVFEGTELQDGRSLRSYNLKRGNVVLVKTIVINT